MAVAEDLLDRSGVWKKQLTVTPVLAVSSSMGGFFPLPPPLLQLDGEIQSLENKDPFSSKPGLLKDATSICSLLVAEIPGSTTTEN